MLSMPWIESKYTPILPYANKPSMGMLGMEEENRLLVMLHNIWPLIHMQNLKHLRFSKLISQGKPKSIKDH
jgi:hypothetical protein